VVYKAHVQIGAKTIAAGVCAVYILYASLNSSYIKYII